jgi:capsular exopolysaccharide synthesis family protein
MSRRASDLAQVLSVLKTGRWLLLTLVIVAAAFAYANSLSQPDRFQATAQLLFGRTTPADTFAAGTGAAAAADPARQAATTLALASLDRVAARTLRQFSGPVTIDNLKNAVNVTASGTSDVLTVTAEWSTPAQAAMLANAFGESIVALREETAKAEVQRSINALNGTIRAAKAAAAPGSATTPEVRTLRRRVDRLRVLRALQTSDVQVVQRATPPKARSAPHPLRNAVVAGFVVLLLGIGLLLLRARFDERLRGEEELTAMIPAPVLARVPPTRPSPVENLSAAAHDASFVEAFEFLRMNLQLMEVTGNSQSPAQNASGGGRPARDAQGRFASNGNGNGNHAKNRAGAHERRLVVAVTSPVAGSGKTTTLCWLARSLAASGERLVTVDLDLRNPTLHECFGVPADERDGAMSAPLEPYGPPHQNAPAPERGELRVLTGGDNASVAVDPAEEARQPLSEMLRRLRTDADYVLVDTSPVATVAHASAVAATVDGVILVVDLERTRRKDVLIAKRQLDNAHANILGIVLNRAPSDSPADVAENDVALDGPTFLATVGPRAGR